MRFYSFFQSSSSGEITLSSSVKRRAPALVALNKQDGALTIIDPSDMKIIGKAPTGGSPREVVLSADGRTAYVANYGAQTPGSSLSVIDIETRKELRRIDLSPITRLRGLVEVGGKFYFTAETNRLIGRYDAATNRVDWLMGTGQNATHMIVVTPDQKRFYTANIGSDSVTAFEFQNAPPAPEAFDSFYLARGRGKGFGEVNILPIIQPCR